MIAISQIFCPSFRDLRESFDVVFVDPPFLSEECLTKAAVTAKFLAKDKIVLCSGDEQQTKTVLEKHSFMIVVTGAVMEGLAGRLLSLKECKFRPGHKNNLANEFRCFANYDLDSHITSSSSTSAENDS